MTNRQTAKILSLRDAADSHGDTKMVEICNAALGGDIAAMIKCGVVAKATRAARDAANRCGPRRSAFSVPTQDGSEDIEDLTGLPGRR